MSPIVVKTAEQMRLLGEAMARILRPGDVLLLSGGMGAGKSELCRGIARGLGISGPVPSPTFTILNVYEEGRLPFHHFDWYRVEGADELLESGLDELISGNFISAIEWHERAAELLPKNCLEIVISQSDDSLQREVSFVPRGEYVLPGLESMAQDAEETV